MHKRSNVHAISNTKDISLGEMKIFATSLSLRSVLSAHLFDLGD